MSSPSSSAEIVEAELMHQLLQYCVVIGPAILVYDSFLTLGSEIRYLPFVDTGILMLYRSFVSAPSIKTCSVLTSCQLWLYVIGIALSELIFLFRTWAVWKNNRILGVLLLSIGGICLVSAMVGIQDYNKSMTFVTGNGVGGCLVRGSNNMLLVDWSMFIVMEAVLLGLVLYRTYRNYKQGHKFCKLMQVVVKDGVLYFAVLFMLTLVNLVVTAMPQLRFAAVVLATPTRVLQSIFAARMVLHIRQVEPEGNEDPDAVLLTTVIPTYFDTTQYGGDLHTQTQTEAQVTHDAV